MPVPRIWKSSIKRATKGNHVSKIIVRIICRFIDNTNSISHCSLQYICCVLQLYFSVSYLHLILIEFIVLTCFNSGSILIALELS